jgi:hypothetical protein
MFLVAAKNEEGASSEGEARLAGQKLDCIDL